MTNFDPDNFKQELSTLSDEELIKAIMIERGDYTEDAINMMEAVLKSREISPDKYSQIKEIVQKTEVESKKNNFNLYTHKNSKQSTAIRARIAGIILSALMLMSATGLIFVQKIPLSAFLKFPLMVPLILWAAIFFVGIGLFFKNKTCWYLAVVVLILFVIVGFNNLSGYNQKYPEKSISLAYQILVCLPFIIPLLLLFSDRPRKWN